MCISMDGQEDMLASIRNVKIALVGANLRSENITNILKSNANEIVAICDNNAEKWGAEFLGYSIISLEEAVAKYNDDVFFIINFNSETHELLSENMAHEDFITTKLSKYGCKNYGCINPLF